MYSIWHDTRVTSIQDIWRKLNTNQIFTQQVYNISYSIRMSTHPTFEPRSVKSSSYLTYLLLLLSWVSEIIELSPLSLSVL